MPQRIEESDHVTDMGVYLLRKQNSNDWALSALRLAFCALHLLHLHCSFRILLAAEHLRERVGLRLLSDVALLLRREKGTTLRPNAGSVSQTAAGSAL